MGDVKNLIENYKNNISKIIGCNPDNILFYKDYPTDYTTKKPFLIKEIKYYKPDAGDPQRFSVRVKVGNKEETISTFALYEMPHCCAFMVSCNANVLPQFRKMGIGKILNNFRIKIGEELGYSAILCTDIEQNVGQRKILKDNNWKDIYEVVNKRTKNKVFLSVINI